VKMSKTKCHPHFIRSTSRAKIASKSCIFLSTYSRILFSCSSHHYASSFLLSHLSNLCSIYSTNALNSSSEVAGFTTWLMEMFIAFHCKSMQRWCGNQIKPKLARLDLEGYKWDACYIGFFL
jgi:hypothetical protein